MKNALDHLGYHTYHMSECIKHWPDRHLHYWDEALKAKYTAQGKPYQVEEFNKIFKGYNAVSDIPSILFVDDLLAAYPKQKSSSPIETLTGGSSRWTVHSTQL
ncbi:hypothetical protein XPA_001069 [Xanthoria parietina]